MSDNARKAEIRSAMEATRAATLRLFDHVPDDFLKRRVHDFYSPIGWHFGHIGMTEEYWVCTRALGRPPLDEERSFLFANLDDNPKDNRVHLPTRAEIVDYLATTRARTRAMLDETDLDTDAPLIADGYAWEFAMRHECQHQETIVELLQLIRKTIGPDSGPLADPLSHHGAPRTTPEMIPIPGGTFQMGTNDRHRYDNEKPMHPVTVAPFAIARTPVTAHQWDLFLQDGGYRRPELWTSEGWQWRTHEAPTYPEYWQPTRNGVNYMKYGATGIHIVDPDEPVCGINWYEADAYARWAGKRLPTEAEWEYAAAYDPTTGASRRHPWSDESQERLERHINSEHYRKYGLLRFRNASFDGPRPVTYSPHPSASASAFGIEGMTTSVWEWTSTPFLPYPGFVAFPYDGYSKDHMDGKHYVCRGGSWATATPILRCTFRNWYVPTYRQGFLGLRLADDI